MLDRMFRLKVLPLSIGAAARASTSLDFPGRLPLPAKITSCGCSTRST